jgi:hypothetical protein
LAELVFPAVTGNRMKTLPGPPWAPLVCLKNQVSAVGCQVS